jgi:hypothetical protein
VLPPFGDVMAGRPWRTDGGRVERWRLAWPILACTAALPLAFAFGLQGVVWTLPALVLGLRLLFVRRPLANDLRMPGATWALAAFLAVAALGIFQVTGTGRIVFTYRWLLFAGALASEVWLLFVPKWQLSTERVVQVRAARARRRGSGEGTGRGAERRGRCVWVRRSCRPAARGQAGCGSDGAGGRIIQR